MDFEYIVDETNSDVEIKESTKILKYINSFITEVNYFSDNIIELYVIYTHISSLSILPENLTSLYLINSNIHSIVQPLPDNLKELYVKNTCIPSIGALPCGLDELYVFGENTYNIDDIPMSLRYLRTGDGIKTIDGIYQCIDDELCLKAYKLIRRFQIRFRKKFETKTKAAKTIQKACHNWLYSPICKDNTYCISLRIGWNQYQKKI